MYLRVKRNRDDKRSSTSIKLVIKDHIAKTPSLIYNYIAAGMAAFSGMGIVFWLPSYFVRYQGMDMKTAGINAGMIAMIGIIGAPIGGIVADWLYRKKPGLRQAFCGISMIVSALGIFLGLAFQDQSWYFACFIIGGFGISMYAGPSAAVVQSVVHPAIRGTAHGLYMTSMLLLGGAWSSTIVGYASDAFGRLYMAMYLFVIASLLAALFYFIGSRYYKRDEEKVKGIQLIEE